MDFQVLIQYVIIFHTGDSIAKYARVGNKREIIPTNTNDFKVSGVLFVHEDEEDTNDSKTLSVYDGERCIVYRTIEPTQPSITIISVPIINKIATAKTPSINVLDVSEKIFDISDITFFTNAMIFILYPFIQLFIRT